MTDDPRLAELDAILRKARGSIARGLALEPQLAAGDERTQARRLVGEALLDLTRDLRSWTEQYTDAGPLATSEQRDELQRLFDLDA